MYDAYGSYDPIFYAAGCMSVASALLMFSDLSFARKTIVVQDEDNKREKPTTFQNTVCSKETSL